MGIGKVVLQSIDRSTSRQEDYIRLSPLSYRGAEFEMVAFSLVSRRSYENVLKKELNGMSEEGCSAINKIGPVRYIQPDKNVSCTARYTVNNYKFHTESEGKGRNTINSHVYVKGTEGVHHYGIFLRLFRTLILQTLIGDHTPIGINFGDHSNGNRQRIYITPVDKNNFHSFIGLRHISRECIAKCWDPTWIFWENIPQSAHESWFIEFQPTTASTAERTRPSGDYIPQQVVASAPPINDTQMDDQEQPEQDDWDITRLFGLLNDQAAGNVGFEEDGSP
ncbi:hypothetical protein QQ045_008141 [Rhodiola kirilowii]